MPTEWNEHMLTIWNLRKDIKACAKALKKPIKQNDSASIRNQVAWIKACCEAILCACNDYESEGE